ncbi:unnamed protein product [Orchesella dallaii]|uniref:Uncharacterized protein n=1 Tax=Orchesella dallaii TaxID=48710 RepID=A0ABP1RK02_9HEXA
MSASIAAANVMAIISKPVNTKLRLNASLHVIVNENLETPYGKFKWIATKIINKNMIELGIQVILFCFMVVVDACMLTFEKSYVKFAFVMNQCWKKLGVELGWPSHKRRPKLPELAIYWMAGCFIAFPLIAVGYPLIGKLDPLQFFAHLCFPTYFKNYRWLSIGLQPLAL